MRLPPNLGTSLSTKHCKWFQTWRFNADLPCFDLSLFANCFILLAHLSFFRVGKWFCLRVTNIPWQYINWFFVSFILFSRQNLNIQPSWPGICNPAASFCQVLGLQTCTAKPRLVQLFFKLLFHKGLTLEPQMWFLDLECLLMLDDLIFRDSGREWMHFGL